MSEMSAPLKAADGGPPLPTWAPKDESSDAAYSLEMIKNGTSVETVPLTASRFLLGRAADCVAYAMAHASISRVHLVFQRSNDGRLYVADCGSAHGSRLNKAPLPPLKYVEARGGDVLQLGASTRVLAIHAAGQDRAARALLENEDVRLDASGTFAVPTRVLAPAEAARSVRAAAEAPRARAAAAAAGGAPQARDAVTWGFAEDAEDARDVAGVAEADLPEYLKTNRGFMEYGGEINSTLKDGEKHAKDAKLHERLETKLRKLNRCRSDNQRLLSKEGGADGLSDGQKRAFDVNDAQIAKLTDEIADLEETIRGRNAQRETSEQRRGRDDGDDDGYLYAKQHERESNVDDDHDLRDLTTPLARARTAEEKAERRRRRFAAPAAKTGGAAPDLKPHLAVAAPDEALTYDALAAKRDAVDAALAAARDAEAGAATATAKTAGDDLDAFMATNDAEAAAARRASARRDAAALEAERARLSRLMDVARPALDGLSAARTPAAVAPAPAAEEEEAEAAEEAAADAPAPAVSAARALLPTPRADAPRERAAAPMAPTLPRRPPSPPPDFETEAKDDDRPAKKKRKRAPRGPKRPPAGYADAAAASLEGGDAAWVPPQGQDGSGRTALNDKLGY